MVLLGYYEILLALLCLLILYFLGTFDGFIRNLPFVGMLPTLLRNAHRIHDVCTKVLSRQCGTFIVKGPYFANMDMVITADPINVQYILSTNFSNFPKGPQFLKIFDILGDGIFNSDGELWEKQRKLAQFHMGQRRFHQFLVKTSQEKVKKGLIPILEHFSKQGLVVDLQGLFQRFTFDTTCILATGYDPGCLSVDLPEVPFSKAVDDAKETIIFRYLVPESFWKLQRWLKVGKEKKLINARATIDRILGNYISNKKEELNKGIKSKEDEGVDLLTSYLTEDVTMGLIFDDKFLRDTILTFMVAGRDTISSALTWFLWLLSTHPPVIAKIREELEAIVPEKVKKKWRLFSADEVSKLVYLHSALCETMRLYPPVPIQHKEPLQLDILPSGHHVHPKMKILLSLYAMGRMKFIWGEDCLQFKPERWISERGNIKHESLYKYAIFNAGPRICLGKTMTFTQIKVIVASMIHNYNVKVVEGHIVAPNVSTLLSMKHGLMVKVTNRWSPSSNE